MKTFIWDCYFPASNRSKVLKSWKSAEKSTWVVNERSGPRKPSINDSVLKGLGWWSLNDAIYMTFHYFSLFLHFWPPPPGRPASAGRGRLRRLGSMDPSLRIHGSQPPDPWIPASGSMVPASGSTDPSLRIHGSQPLDPWIRASGSMIPASGSTDPSLRIHGSQPPDPRIRASGSMDPSLWIHGSSYGALQLRSGATQLSTQRLSRKHKSNRNTV